MRVIPDDTFEQPLRKAVFKPAPAPPPSTNRII